MLIDFSDRGGTLTISRARLLELDPLYCDVICRRWIRFSGQPAILEASGDAFAETPGSGEAGDD